MKAPLTSLSSSESIRLYAGVPTLQWGTWTSERVGFRKELGEYYYWQQLGESCKDDQFLILEEETEEIAALFEQAEEREQVNGGFKDKHSFALAPVAEVKGFVAAFHIKAEVSRRSLAVGVARYSVLVPPHKYGVVVGCVLVNIAAGKEKARHIFINAAGLL